MKGAVGALLAIVFTILAFHIWIDHQAVHGMANWVAGQMEKERKAGAP